MWNEILNDKIIIIIEIERNWIWMNVACTQMIIFMNAHFTYSFSSTLFSRESRTSHWNRMTEMNETWFSLGFNSWWMRSILWRVCVNECICLSDRSNWCEPCRWIITQQRKQRRRRQRERNKSMKRRRRRSDRTLYIHEGKNSVRVRKLRLQLRKKCDANSVVHVRNRDNAIDRMLRTLQTHSSNDFSDEDTLLARNVRILYSE